MNDLLSRGQSAIERRQQQLLKWKQHNNDDDVKLDVKRDVKVSFPLNAVLFASIQEKDFETANKLIESNLIDLNVRNEDGLTVLHQAVIDDNGDAIDWLLQYKHLIDLNACDNEGWTPLHAAASCGHLIIAKKLVDAGASIEVVNADGELPMDIADSDEMESLLMISNEQRLNELRNKERLTIENDLTKWLSQGKVIDPIDKSNGATVLHVCAAKGYHHILETILNTRLKDSIDINACDSDGWTPLMAACHWQQTECVQILLNHNASITMTSSNGLTCESLCNDNTIILQLLQTKHKQLEQIQNENSSETQRRLHAKKVRETRRSTQGIKQEDVTAAIQLFKNDNETPPQLKIERPTNQLPSRQSSASSLSSSQRSIECVNGCVECGKLKQKLNDLEIERKEWMKEKRSFQRKISEFEEELKSFDLIKQENLKLKDENCALIRVISKLSK